MKKTLAFLMVFILLGPWLALICQCCPMAKASPVEVPTFTSRGCDCCADSFNIEQKQGILESLNFFFNFSFARFFYPGFITAKFIETAAGENSSVFNHFESPPPFLSETPLYLSLQILRI